MTITVELTKEEISALSAMLVTTDFTKLGEMMKTDPKDSWNVTMAAMKILRAIQDK